MLRRSIALMLAIALGSNLTRADEASETRFDREIAPLLAARCLECHNPTEKRGGLDLTTSAGAEEGGDSGPAIERGDPDLSLLWARIEADEMPPKHPLAEKERELLRAWIADGARWGSGPIDRFRYSSDVRAGYDWWSLQPLAPPESPTPAHSASARNEIDRFVLAALEAKGLALSAEAPRATLIRRVTFDLTGLPPTPEQIADFVADPAPDAYERLVDGLLASPDYGVRWARHWLDVVRFAESNGFEYDELRPDAWPYRDWVVQALNDDLPYDEFVRLQLAGDALRPNDLDAAIATGFLAAGAYDTAGQSQQSAAMRAVVRQDELEDLVGVVGQTFLGLTVNCARCHDHKFDPIRQHEYYSLTAALAGVKHGARELRDIAATGPRAERIARLDAELAAARQELVSLEAPAREQLALKRDTRLVELRPLAEWNFAENPQPESLGLELRGGAHLTAEGLALDGKSAYAESKEFEVPLGEKTLEVWVTLDNVEQRGGAALSAQTPDGLVFDAIVFGERDPGQWLAGSDNFARTQGFAALPETKTARGPIHVCVTYASDGTVTAYRDGVPYGTAYRAPGVAAFEAGRWQVLIGLRHNPSAPGKLLAGVVHRARIYDRALTADEVALSSGTALTSESIRAELSPDDRNRHERLSAAIAKLEARRLVEQPPRIYTSIGKPPEPTHLLARGNPAQALEELAPGGIAAVVGISADFELANDAPEPERRVRLANWITGAGNPLFARVIVNRVWHHHFGLGLVDTPNDFGFNGGRPSHPELLDWLAADFVAKGYRLKRLHRQIVTSAAYRQRSEFNDAAARIDADNRLLWRKSPQRLEAEAVRDAMLSVAGALDSTLGGPGFREMKIEVAPGTNTYLYSPDDPARPEFKRRTLYRVWARSGRSPLLDVLDCPDPSTTSPKRAVTTTPLQALALLNNAFVLHLADLFAERLAREAGQEPEVQAELAYRLALGRPPDDAERAAAARAIREHGLLVLARAMFNSNEFIYVD